MHHPAPFASSRRLLTALVVAGSVAWPLAGCATGTVPATAAATPVDDATVATRVRARLAEDPALAALRIQVDTLNGAVQLAGFVATQADKDKAGEIARGVPDVRRVVNNLIVRPAQTP